MATTTAASSEPAVELEQVEVRFRVLASRTRSLKEYVLQRLAGKVEFNEFLALRSVSFAVGRGETFGIVGRNGAGKSTLLKVISRVLHPTGGRVVVRGRVAPMLELGAGFHPDMTGRENVLLNASILGYPHREIRRRVDEIVEFAELTDFVEAPVRTYSSGMQARLGFAVATLFRPDVLILDEVLAVGDLGFQAKCVERIAQFQSRGTSVILVSHSLDLIAAHCQRAAWLDHGELAAIGPTDEVLGSYRASFALPG